MTCRAVFFDLDGTLVDTNQLHVDAWVQAFADAGHRIEPERIAGQIGKGADNLVPALLPGADEATAEALGEAHGRIFKDRYLHTAAPFPQAHALVARVHASGRLVALASSAGKEELDHYQQLLDLAGLVDVVTTIDDVEHSKPAPDIFAVALKKAGDIAAADVVVVGDSPFDMEGARRCGMTAVAVRSGGFDDAALSKAGAAAIYDDVAELLARFDGSLLAG
jgi:membrane protein